MLLRRNFILPQLLHNNARFFFFFFFKKNFAKALRIPALLINFRKIIFCVMYVRCYFLPP